MRTTNPRLLPHLVLRHRTVWVLLSVFLIGMVTLAATPALAATLQHHALPGHTTPSRKTTSSTPSCSPWATVASPNPGSLLDALNGVAADSANDVWAVGFSGATGSSGGTLVEHWNGSAWSVIPSPNVGAADNVLDAVAAISPTNVWAVGEEYSNSGGSQAPTALIEHWNGSAWSVVPAATLPSPGLAGLYGISALSATNIWAVGIFYGGSYQTLMEHWNGSAWSLVPSPNAPGTTYNYLHGVSAVSASDVWAVGEWTNALNASGTLTEHWNGTAWSIVSTPSDSASGYLEAVAARSANDIWAVGNSTVTSGNLTEHWNGTTWSIVPAPNLPGGLNLLTAITAVPSSGEFWAVGYHDIGSTGEGTLIEQWNGTAWSIVSSATINGGPGTSLLGVVAPSLHSAWAVGKYSPSGQGWVTLTQNYRAPLLGIPC